MKISKITKILPLALALSMTGVFATESTTATVNYQLTLEDYIKITTSTEALSSDTTFGANYGDITIKSDMTGKFNIISNAKQRTMELKATNVDGENPLYAVTFDNSAGTGTAKLVFAHTTEIPDGTSIANITGGTPAADSNPNAIAFNVTLGQTYEHGPGTIAGAWDGTNKKIVYTMDNGVSDLTIKVGGKNIDKTFNTQDQSGIYKATLTLTDVGPVTAGGGEPEGN